MKKLSITAALAVATIFSAFSVKADNIAYMTVFTGGDFGTVNLDTGAFTLLGNSGQTLAGLGVANGTLYASSLQGANPGSLYSVNPANGSLTLISSSGIPYDMFGSTTQGLYAIGSDSNLYSINSTTGVPTLIGPIGMGLGGWRNVSTNASRLYLAQGANFYTLDTTTGAATLIGNMGGPQMGAMLLQGGILYGGQEAPGLRVDTIDPITGVATMGPVLTGASAAFGGLAPYPLATPPARTISGRVTTAGGGGIVNVTVQLTGSDTRQRITDANGFYSFKSLTAGGNYTVTPLQTQNLSISPVNRVFNNLTTDQTADFTGTPSTFTIGGTVAGPDGIGVNGITISLSGAASKDAITDSSGRYAFGNLVTGSYTVTPAANPNFTFNPSNYVFNNINSNQAAGFTATSTVPPATNGRIVFESYGILVMDGDGKHITRLTNRSDLNYAPKLSRDGTKIAFRSFRDGDYEIYVMNADGSNQTRLTNSPSYDGSPAWSPDGAKIAFVSTRDGNPGIYVMNADGSNLTRLTNSPTSEQPAWSPDGSRIALQSFRDGDYEIYVMNADGSNQTRLTNSPGLDLGPAWSPGGGKIAFLSTRVGPTKIFTMDPDGGNQTRLTDFIGPGFDDGPAWSPDGRKIAFCSQRGLAYYPDIYVMNADGSDRTRLTTSRYNQSPSWGPQATVATGNVITGSGHDDVTVQLGNVMVTYANVNTAGTTAITPIAPTSVLPLPAGYATIASVGLAYDITTTATVTPPITACFKVSSINDQAVFNSLRVLHGENGVLVDRTIPPPNFATRTICASVDSLSPFVIVQAIDPSLPVIDGLVVDGNGQPLSDFDVTLSGDRTLTTQTDINGRFLFVNLIRGGNYTVTPSAGAFAFNPQNKSFQNIQNDQAQLFVGSVPPASQLLNISTRMRVLTDENVLIGGFIITGTQPKRVIVRAIGPSLGAAGVPGALADPTLELHEPGDVIVTNDDWRTDQEAEIIATTIPPSNDLESAIVATLNPGTYTAIVRGKNGGTGVGLVEAYDLNQTANSKLANISTRGFVETGDNVMIGGFIVGPPNGANATVVVRAIGPSLSDFGISGALQDPTLDLVNSNGVVIRSNNNWIESQPTEIMAIELQPSDGRESALIETLAPGSYTAIVRGNGDTTGVALVEVYNIP